MRKSLTKSRRLSGVAVDASLRGRGPAPGAPNAGRPPSDVVLAYRKSFADRLHIAESIADDLEATNMERLRALELLGKFGGMLTVQVSTESVTPQRRQYMRFGDVVVEFAILLCLVSQGVSGLGWFG